ncbi:hypothetical protein QJS10_CPA03g00630 [Acorus calamus]|uniref:Uncharacterized protein n=1 Tax=Acorus calamus TaxID=4465 RepID=A0AAV9F8G9_ACOCL|nr:hypothetical protein QJS10_CPA03g00630 [Acorus calamus]
MKTFICIISLALCACLFASLQELKKEEVKAINPTAADCMIRDVVVQQGAVGTLPNGIPRYSVVILNVNPKNKTVMNVHIKCGWFASYNLVDPSIFRRLAHDDCLVNNGQPIPTGQAIGFSYSNSFSYPMTVSTVACS